MILERLFPADNVLAQPTHGLPESWNDLLAMSLDSARCKIADSIGLPECEGRLIINSGTEIGVLVPKKKRHSGNKDLWQLALTLTHQDAMVFGIPTSLWNTQVDTLPSEYLETCSTLGPVAFTQWSGRVIPPEQIVEKSSEVCRKLAPQHTPESLLAFFDSGTGDYDCWVDGNFLETWYLDHETHDLRLRGLGGFSCWFSARLMEHVPKGLSKVDDQPQAV